MTPPRTTAPGRRAPRLLAVAALPLALLLAGCGGEDDQSELADSTATATASVTATPSGSPSDSPSASPSQPAERSVRITVSSDEVKPVAKALEVAVGEPLTLEIRSNRSGELHVHSSPEREVPFASGSTSVDLTFDKPGQVDVEEHESGALILRILVR